MVNQNDLSQFSIIIDKNNILNKYLRLLLYNFCNMKLNKIELKLLVLPFIDLARNNMKYLV